MYNDINDAKVVKKNVLWSAGNRINIRIKWANHNSSARDDSDAYRISMMKAKSGQVKCRVDHTS